MRRKRVITFSFYILFLALIGLTFLISLAITGGRSKEPANREDFTIMKRGEEISALYYDGENVWVGCNDGVYLYDADTKEEVNYFDGLHLIYAAGIAESADGTVWIGHEDGLTGIVGKNAQERIDFEYPEIPKGRINTVEWDGERLWIGTYNGGACLTESENGWQVEKRYDKSSGLCSDSVNVIRSTEQNTWFASYLDSRNGGISIFDGEGFKYITVADGLPHPYVTSLQYLGDGKMLAGTGYMDEGGLALIQKINGKYGVAQTYYAEDGIPGKKVRQLFLDEDGYLWITTEYDGVVIVNYAKDGLQEHIQGVYLTEENGLSDNEIKCITETPREYWLGGKYGLTIIDRTFLKDRQ